ncbi:MAG: HEAT repeat domain-containing protein [Nitrospinota bacterium]|nr:HEAT repeat domain-containing protein [Nitrospinota bacterium]MDH5678184.1 HEAT repeat domain-containing protein [Nitrospinota bacterium]
MTANIKTCAIILMLMLAPAGCATLFPESPKPTIPKERIPPEIPAGVKTVIEDLYARSALDRAKAAMMLSIIGDAAKPAAPFLASLMYDDTKGVIRKHKFYEELPKSHWSGLWNSMVNSVEIETTPGLESSVALVILGEHETVINALKDEKESVRIHASRALAEWKDPRSIEPLIQSLNDANGNVRLNAANGLANFNDPRIVEPLIISLKDDDIRICRVAAEALGKLNDSRAIEPLARASNTKDYYLLTRIQKALYILTGERYLTNKQWLDWLEREKAKRIE